MPFKSKAQRRKFYALKSQGKMDQKTIDEWEDETPSKLPEKVGSKRIATLKNMLMDAQGQIIQEDPGYEKLRKRMRKEAFWDGFEKKAWFWSKKKEEPKDVFHTGLEHHIESYNTNAIANKSSQRARLLSTDVSDPERKQGWIGIYEGENPVGLFHAHDNSKGQITPIERDGKHPAIVFKQYAR